jgi:hypothetical protein
MGTLQRLSTESPSDNTLIAFARQYRLKARPNPDDDGAEVILGRQGQIYEYDENQLAVLFMPPGEPRPRMWTTFKRAAIGLGMVLRQNGDAEGALSFDPANPKQAKLAIKIAGAKRKRRLSSEHRTKLLIASKASQFSKAREAVLIAT